MGFVLTGIPGMAATALCLAVLAYQARTAAVFGRKMAIFTWIVAAVLLLSFLFAPILALMAWIVVCIINARRTSHAPPGTQATPNANLTCAPRPRPARQQTRKRPNRSNPDSAAGTIIEPAARRGSAESTIAPRQATKRPGDRQ